MANELESRYLMPLNTRVNRILDEAEDLAGRVRMLKPRCAKPYQARGRLRECAVAAVRARSWPPLES